MRIPESFISDLIARTNIVDILSQSLSLKKRGANYICCCPFHNEKTASFSVSETKQIYKCFGCGQSGNVLSFLMDYSHLSYVEAIEFLAKFHGLTIPREYVNYDDYQQTNQQNKNKDNYELLTNIIQQVADYYFSQLQKSEIGKKYCKSRGISDEIAKFFYLGFAPNAWDNLKILCDNNVEKYQKNELLKLAGLTIENVEKKRCYDRFRNRLMIPIFDIKGKIIAFGGRILSAANQHNNEVEQAKYLNSPETPIFIKGQNLFGLYQAKNFIYQNNDEIIVCEGYLDVIMLKQFGVDNAIATLGTATTSQQIRTLLRYAKKVIFCFDGDNAGRIAATRAMQNALSEISDDKILQFAFLPENEDPDSFIRNFGVEKFRAFLQTSKNLSELFLENLAIQKDLSKSEGKSQFINEAKKYLPLLKKSPLLQIQLIKQIAEITNFSETEIYEICNININININTNTNTNTNFNKIKKKSTNLVENFQKTNKIFPTFEKNPSTEFIILKYLIKYPQWLNDENLEITIFAENSEERNLLEILLIFKDETNFIEAIQQYFAKNATNLKNINMQKIFEKILFNCRDLQLKQTQYEENFQHLLNLLKNKALKQNNELLNRKNFLKQKIENDSATETEKYEYLEILNLLSIEK